MKLYPPRSVRNVLPLLIGLTLAVAACSNGPIRKSYSTDPTSAENASVNTTGSAPRTTPMPNPDGGNPYNSSSKGPGTAENSSGNASIGKSRNGTSESENASSPKSNEPDAVKRAQSFYASGNHSAALESLNSVLPESLKPSSQTEYWNLKGLVELANRNPQASEASFRNAISVNPSPEWLGYYQYNLASALADEKKTDEALKELNQINSSALDASDQKKIALLKDKLSHGQTGSLIATASPSPSLNGTPVPAQAVFSGPTRSNRVGILLPLTGKYETFGKKVQKAIELAFQNSQVAKDREIELIPIDSGDTAQTHHEALKKLVEEHEVIAVIGPLLSKGVEALPERSDYYQVPVVSIAQVQGTASPHIFSCSVSTGDQASKIVDYAMNTRGFRNFAILAPSNKPGEEMAQAFWDQVSAHGGEIKAYETYEPGLTDFREPVDKTLGLFYTDIRAKELKELADKRAELKITKKTMKTLQYFALTPIVDFDAVFIADEAKTVGQIIPTFTYRDAKNLPYLGITTWNSNQLVARAGDQAEGATFPVAFNTLNPPPETKSFYDLYNATYSAPPGELDATAYDAATAVIEVLKEKPSTREEFTKKFSHLEKIDGATGVFAIKNQRCSRELTLYTVKKGEFEPVKSEPIQSETHSAN